MFYGYYWPGVCDFHETLDLMEIGRFLNATLNQVIMEPQEYEKKSTMT
jgi:hypothetical protein